MEYRQAMKSRHPLLILPVIALAALNASNAFASIDAARLTVLNTAQTVKAKVQTQCKDFKESATASLRNGTSEAGESFADPFPSPTRAKEAYRALKLYPFTSVEQYQADHTIIFGASAPSSLEFQLLDDVDPCPTKTPDQLGLALRLIKSANPLSMTVSGRYKLVDLVKKQLSWELKHPLSADLGSRLMNVSEELSAMDKEGLNKLGPDQLATLSQLKAALDARQKKLPDFNKRIPSSSWKDLSAEQLQLAWMKNKDAFNDLGPFIPKVLQMIE
jgi:hypothetical protein